MLGLLSALPSSQMWSSACSRSSFLPYRFPPSLCISYTFHLFAHKSWLTPSCFPAHHRCIHSHWHRFRLRLRQWSFSSIQSLSFISNVSRPFHFLHYMFLMRITFAHYTFLGHRKQLVPSLIMQVVFIVHTDSVFRYNMGQRIRPREKKSCI